MNSAKIVTMKLFVINIVFTLKISKTLLLHSFLYTTQQFVIMNI